MDKSGSGGTFATIKRIILMLAGIIVVWMIFSNVAYGGNEATENQLNSVTSDFDGDGINNFRDDCPCTTGNQKRDIRGSSYCVAEAEPSAFSELESYLKENEPAVFERKYVKQDSTVYYQSQVCEIGIQEGLWPTPS